MVGLRAVRARDHRVAWALIAVGLASYVAGNLLWVARYEADPDAPIPSVYDGLWLAFYPAV